jgi:hypothetical protein
MCVHQDHGRRPVTQRCPGRGRVPSGVKPSALRSGGALSGPAHSEKRVRGSIDLVVHGLPEHLGGVQARSSATVQSSVREATSVPYRPQATQGSRPTSDRQPMLARS